MCGHVHEKTAKLGILASLRSRHSPHEFVREPAHLKALVPGKATALEASWAGDSPQAIDRSIAIMGRRIPVALAAGHMLQSAVPHEMVVHRQALLDEHPSGTLGENGELTRMWRRAPVDCPHLRDYQRICGRPAVALCGPARVLTKDWAPLGNGGRGQRVRCGLRHDVSATRRTMAIDRL